VAAEIKTALSVESRLVEGSNGVFTVRVDGKVVFSKDRQHRFPEKGELPRLMKA